MEGHGGGSGGGCSRCLHPLLLFAAFVAVVSIGRLFYMLHCTGRPFHPGEALRRARARALIILGSGGHTTEMLNLQPVLDKDKFVPRYYVAAVTDSMSLQKAWVFEGSLVQ